MSIQGFRVDFAEEGSAIDFSHKMTGFDTTLQNAVVNVGQRASSDPVYPRKGISLFQQSLSGALVDVNSAGHYVNFAALSTISFSRQTELSGNAADALLKFSLKITRFLPGTKMELDVSATSTAGRTSFTSAVL